MDADFPAAHSMDSCWFAVDRDGHVAYFSTDEAGAMPQVGVTGDDALELRDRLGRSAPACEVIHDPRGHVLPGEEAGPVEIQAQDWPVLVFLTSMAPVQTDVEAGRATPVRTTEGYAVVFRRLTAEQARRLTESGAVTTSAFYSESAEGESAHPSGFGLYEYGHLCENWISGPYGRERLPARPLHVDQLPPAIRKQLKEATLADRTFTETPHIQPAEHWACHSTEWDWQGLDGTVHPFEYGEEE